MTDGRTDEQRLTAVMQRLKARLPGVDLRGIALDEEAVSLTVGIDVEAAQRAGVHLTSDTDEIRVVRRVWDEGDTPVVAAFASLFPGALNEITLAQDLAVVLNDHQLRIAETQTGVTAKPRERVDPAEAYTAEEAEEDVMRLARALADYEPGGPWPDEAACVAASRKQAALILSKLHGWRRGAPPSSAGHHHARAVFEDETGGER